MAEWGIVGGGILGMRLAQQAARAGHAVSLFESAPQFGGLAAAWQIGDVVWDRHYHVILLSDSHTRSLLKELGLENETRWVPTRTGFYTDGKFYSMSNAAEFLRFPPLGLIDKFRLGATIFYASRIRSWERLEAIPVAEWLERLSGRNAFKRIWLPLLRSKLGENYKDTSAAFIWATIARMYAARRAGLERELFGYCSGGYARILDRYVSALKAEGVQLHAGQTAARVARTAGGRVEVNFRDGTAKSFDRVALTAPSHAVAALCPELSEDERRRMLGIRYMGIVCVSLLLKKPLGGYYITNITEPWVPFTAVIEMSALVDRAEFGGHCLAYLPKYLSPDDPMFEEPEESIRQRFVEALRRMHGHLLEDDVLHVKVSKVRYVVPLTTLNYSKGLAPMRTTVEGLWAVNSTHIQNGTLNVNETINLADRAWAEMSQ